MKSRTESLPEGQQALIALITAGLTTYVAAFLWAWYYFTLPLAIAMAVSAAAIYTLINFLYLYRSAKRKALLSKDTAGNRDENL